MKMFWQREFETVDESPALIQVDKDPLPPKIYKTFFLSFEAVAN